MLDCFLGYLSHKHTWLIKAFKKKLKIKKGETMKGKTEDGGCNYIWKKKM